MEPLDTIRKNLVEASGAVQRIFPAPPVSLIAEIQTAWQRYSAYVELENQKTSLPGKSQLRKSQEEFGFIWYIIGGAVALSALLGGGAALQHELTESERLKKLANCIADLTSQGISQAQATKICNDRFGKGKTPLISVGGEFNPTAILAVGGIGLLLFFLLGKGLK